MKLKIDVLQKCILHLCLSFSGQWCQWAARPGCFPAVWSPDSALHNSQRRGNMLSTHYRAGLHTHMYTQLFSPSWSISGTLILTPSRVSFSSLQAVDSRDSVAMALYSQCFSWIILKINQKIKGKENFKSIGILDIFGFENFEVRTSSCFARSFSLLDAHICLNDTSLCLQVNRFEQFNINYANEKLQEYFNKHIFSLEQLEYNRCAFTSTTSTSTQTCIINDYYLVI